MEQHHFKSLLSQVTTLNNHYKKINDLTGENFNVFRILKVETLEVRMHSAFIAELLNPKGSHGQNDTFLRLFIERFCFKLNQFDSINCNSNVELHTAFISKDGSEGGRIDIIVTDQRHNKIIIENKIYTGDQDQQLIRYHNHDPNADLFYLTLDGKTPGDTSKGNLKDNVDFRCISYKQDILIWLEACRKEVTVNPIVRESITQYINLIKYLTNQTINRSMQIELNDLIKSNLEASFTIKDNLNNALNEVVKDYTSQLESICEPLGLICSNTVNFENRYTGFWVYKSEWEHTSIGFQFQNYNKELLYGLVVEHPDEFPKDLRAQLNSLPNNSKKYNDWWPWHNYVEQPFADWSKVEAWKAVEAGSMKNMMKQKIEMLLTLIGDIKL